MPLRPDPLPQDAAQLSRIILSLDAENADLKARVAFLEQQLFGPKSEKMTTLDGVERELDGDTVLVCDREGPSGIAALMGGQVSEVSDETTEVLLEVANWNGANVLRTSRRLSLRSEASARFEKQLHPDLTMRAQAIASRLLVELAGAKLVPGTIDVAAPAPEPHTLRLRGARVTGILGMEIPQSDQVAYLERLGFGARADGEDLEVVVPADRYYDVTREIDLIEEVGRLHGFDRHLPTTLPRVGAGKVGRLNRTQRLRRRAEDELRETELTRRAVTYSYRDGDAYVFMDSEDFTQYTLDAAVVGDAAGYITDGIEGCYVQLIDDAPVALQLPPTVALEVVDTAPELKGATATKRPKPATLATGIEIQVPEYITSGEKVLVNTATGEFSGRA